jgi:hypothetical protein
MKIKLKINNDSLKAIRNSLQKLYDLQPTTDRTMRVYRSIGYKLAETFDAKYKKEYRNSNLFNQKKKYTIGLEFHEAVALQKILIEINDKDPLDNELHQTLINKQIHFLDEKTV